MMGSELSHKFRIILLDVDERVCDAWRANLAKLSKATQWKHTLNGRNIDVIPTNKSLNDLELDAIHGRTAIVSPGNSIGFLGGGFDLYIAKYFNPGNWKQFEWYFQKQLFKKTNGYSNRAQVVQLDKEEIGQAWDKLRCDTILHLPTMKVPSKIHSSVANQSVFDLTWDALNCMRLYNENQKVGSQVIDTLIFPGLGTGYGGVSPEVCAKAMCYSIYIYSMDCDEIKKAKLCLQYVGENHAKLFKGDKKRSFDYRIDTPETLFENV